MAALPSFESTHLEAICRALADTDRGLTGTEIGSILEELGITDLTPSMTKWKRLFNALAHAQNKHQVGNHVVLFINSAMSPARYATAPDTFAWRQDALNVALAFVGYAVNDSGKVVRVTVETTLKGARARARRLLSKLEGRGTHEEIFKYCTAELVHDNYFHAVFEAAKGMAERIRQMSGLSIDGAELATTALSIKAPKIALTLLQSESERSEQKGIANLLVGIFGAIRNPTAHAPRLIWVMTEQDAIDLMGILSYIHRKLDSAVWSVRME